MDKKDLPLGLRLVLSVKEFMSSKIQKRNIPKPNRFTRMVVRYTMQWDGLEREYYVYAPDQRNNSNPSPLYISLHGLTGIASTSIFSSFVPILCDLNGGILVFPQGLEFLGLTGWNAGVVHSLKGKSYALHGDYDDVGFLMNMIDELSKIYNIDNDRIFVQGFSMGGFMANRLAIEHGDRFRAVCSINGTIGAKMIDKVPKCPVNFLHIHGTSDKDVDYYADLSKNPRSHGIGAEQVVDYWRTHNQCVSEPIIYDYPHLSDNDITFQMREYAGGTNGAKTAFIKAVNGTHTWYDWTRYDISYSIEVMRYFASVPLLKQ